MKVRTAVRKRRKIETLALIDSMFLILVFFLYAFLSMTVNRGMPVDLPKVKSALTDKRDYHAITVTSDGKFFFDKKEVSFSELEPLFKELRRDEKEPLIYLNGDKAAKHGDVVSVLDMLKRCGIKKISIEVEKDE